MRERRIGAVMIVEQGRLEGIVTERDLVFRLLAEQLDAAGHAAQRQIMTRDPETLRPDDSALAALDKMRAGPLPASAGGRRWRDRRDRLDPRPLRTVRRSLEEELRSAESLIYGEQYGLASA